jgi:putative iron-only hydrogenase system regulator
MEADLKRIGVVGIVITNPHTTSVDVQNILSDFSDIIVGRMGVPIPEHNIGTISIIVNGSTERISALTGKLGRLESVNVKSALTTVETE